MSGVDELSKIAREALGNVHGAVTSIQSQVEMVAARTRDDEPEMYFFLKSIGMQLAMVGVLVEERDFKERRREQAGSSKEAPARETKKEPSNG